MGPFRNAGGWTLPWVSVRERRKEEGWGKSLRARLSLAYAVGTFSGSHWGLTCENTWLDLEFRKKTKVQAVPQGAKFPLHPLPALEAEKQAEKTARFMPTAFLY